MLLNGLDIVVNDLRPADLHYYTVLLLLIVFYVDSSGGKSCCPMYKSTPLLSGLKFVLNFSTWVRVYTVLDKGHL